jgi:predicted O-methyltransferase YrrM
LELGCYLGHTSVWLCQTLQRMGGGKYIGVELEADRQAITLQRLSKLHIPDVEVSVLNADSLVALRSLPAGSIDFAWVDDDHTPAHVAQELELLYNTTAPEDSKMAPGGIITMHDVYGDGRMPGLAGVCVGNHGYALSFPRIGALGGIGIIQRPA